MDRLKFNLFLTLLFLQPIYTHASTSVADVAVGFGDSLFLKSDGSLWDMGDNRDRQLGNGTFVGTNRPVQLVAGQVVAVAAGASFSLFVKTDGSLWAMGYNGYGALGDGTWNNTNQPEQIVSSNVTAVSAGAVHAMFLKSDGSLWTMGGNLHGQLGDATTDNTNVPQEIVSNNVVAIASGWSHSLFLKSDGSLWGMGFNQFGALGDGTYNDTSLPEEIISSNVVAIAGGFGHSLFVKKDGSLWAMGENSYGQLGDGTSGLLNDTNVPEQIISSNVVAVAAGDMHSLFLKNDSSLWGMGYNGYGQLGDGTLTDTNRPEQIRVGAVARIAVGGNQNHSLFLKSDGSLWATGRNEWGELGDGFTNGFAVLPEQIYPQPQPVLASSLSAGTNLQFTATCGFGATFCLLAGTNVNQPLSQWTPVATNIIGDRANNLFTAAITNAVTLGSAQQFFILQAQ